MAGRTKNSRLNPHHTFDDPFWVGVDIDWHVLRPLAIHHSKGVAEARSIWAPSEREINHGLGAVKTLRPPSGLRPALLFTRPDCFHPN